MNTSSDPNQPPADAPEPPWVDAAKRLSARDGSMFEWTTEYAANIIQQACESHAAALAQERDLVKEQLAHMAADLERVLRDRDEALEQVDALNKGCVELERTVAACREALELARPIVKHRLCDGNVPERGYYAALEALDKIEVALTPQKP